MERKTWKKKTVELKTSQKRQATFFINSNFPFHRSIFKSYILDEKILLEILCFPRKGRKAPSKLLHPSLTSLIAPRERSHKKPRVRVDDLPRLLSRNREKRQCKSRPWKRSSVYNIITNTKPYALSDNVETVSISRVYPRHSRGNRFPYIYASVYPLLIPWRISSKYRISMNE